jgi:hypothetical protein
MPDPEVLLRDRSGRPILGVDALGNLEMPGAAGLPRGFAPFVPTLGGSTSESGQVYTVRLGYAFKYGPIVVFKVRVQVSTVGTITGAVQIKGLPFPEIGQDANAFATVGVGAFLNLAATLNWIGAIMTPGGTSLTLQKLAAAGVSVVTLAQADLAANFLIDVGGVYLTGA